MNYTQNITNMIISNISNITHNESKTNDSSRNNPTGIYVMIVLLVIFGSMMSVFIYIMFCGCARSDNSCREGLTPAIKEIYNTFCSTPSNTVSQTNTNQNNNDSESESDYDYYQPYTRQHIERNRRARPRIINTAYYSEESDSDSDYTNENSNIYNYKNKINKKEILTISNINKYPVFCSICQENQLNTVKTNCGHYYCLDCIEQYLKNSALCPNCKEVINTIYSIKYIDIKNELK